MFHFSRGVPPTGNIVKWAYFYKYLKGLSRKWVTLNETIFSNLHLMWTFGKGSNLMTNEHGCSLAAEHSLHILEILGSILCLVSKHRKATQLNYNLQCSELSPNVVFSSTQPTLCEASVLEGVLKGAIGYRQCAVSSFHQLQDLCRRMDWVFSIK